jgi:hypothetical protein
MLSLISMMRMFWALSAASTAVRRATDVEPMGPPGGHGPKRQHHHATERDAGCRRCAADRAAEIRLLEACPIARYHSPPFVFRGSRGSFAGGVVAWLGEN